MYKEITVNTCVIPWRKARLYSGVEETHTANIACKVMGSNLSNHVNGNLIFLPNNLISKRIKALS